VTDTAVPPPPILHYAPQAPPPRSKRWPARIGIILICGLFGAVLGRAQATSYTATGIMSVAPVMWGSQPQQQQSVAGLTASQRQHVGGIVSATNAAAASRALTAMGGPRVSASDIQKGLRAAPIPESRLLRVTYDGESPRVASAVVYAAMQSYAAANPATGVVSAAAASSTPTHAKLFLAGGFAIGASLGLAIVVLRRR
jgi:hypothetical protein